MHALWLQCCLDQGYEHDAEHKASAMPEPFKVAWTVISWLGRVLPRGCGDGLIDGLIDR